MSREMSISSRVLITGAAGALGNAVTRELIARDYRALLIDRTLEALAPLVRELGEAVHTETVDVTRPETWADVLSRSEVVLRGPLTHAALLAGGYEGGAPLHAEDSDATWTSMMTANLETVHVALRAILPRMVTERRGSIVVIGSRAVERPWTSTGSAAYAASKAAVVALAQTVAAEVRPFGVRVNAVLPSTLDTPANRAAMPDADFSRWVSLPSIARVIAFLLSDDARDVSGAAVPVYGLA